MNRGKKQSGRKRTVKAVKRFSRRIHVPPTKVHDSGKKPRRRPRTVEEHLEEEGWE